MSSVPVELIPWINFNLEKINKVKEKRGPYMKSEINKYAKKDCNYYVFVDSTRKKQLVLRVHTINPRAVEL